MSNTLLTIAGFDPTSGAGVTLDLAVFRSLGFHGTALITALTIQNTRKVSETRITPGDFLERQYRSLAADIPFAGIKLGMLGSGEILPVLDRILTENPNVPVVADPVIRSSSGTELMDEAALPRLLDILSRRASLLTPNLDEAALISGYQVRDREDLAAGAKAVFQRCRVPVLLKGGHLPGEAVDYLFDGSTGTAFPRPRVDFSVHGTGCFLSAAVLGGLAEGLPLFKACQKAGDLLAGSLKKARQIGFGQRLFSL